MKDGRVWSIAMPNSRRTERSPHTYATWAQRVDPEEKAQVRLLLSLRRSFGESSRDCEVQRSPEGLFCVKHRRPVKGDALRCDSFVRRRAFADADDYTREQIEDYVKEVLGIKKGKNFERLLGWRGDGYSAAGSRPDE
jgi:hypothetical protein